MAKKLTFLEYVNARMMPPGFELRIADPRPRFEQAADGAIRRALLVAPKGWPAARRRLRTLAKRAAAQTGPRQARTYEQMRKIQLTALGKALRPAPADPWVRFVILHRGGLYADDYGVVTARPSARPPRWPGKVGAETKLTPPVKEEISRLRDAGLSDRQIAARLSISRPTLQKVPRPQ
jgi:hypothetical protein